MGFADLSIAEITTDYSISVAKVFSLCNQLLIAYKHQKTLLALEDATAIISQLLSETHRKGINDSVSDTDVNSRKDISGFN